MPLKCNILLEISDDVIHVAVTLTCITHLDVNPDQAHPFPHDDYCTPCWQAASASRAARLPNSSQMAQET